MTDPLLLDALTALKHYRTRAHVLPDKEPNYRAIGVVHEDVMVFADRALAEAKARGITIPEVGP